MTRLIGKISILIFMCVLCQCTEIESDKGNPKTGTYVNRYGNEAIIILDSMIYIHRYKKNDIFYSDTSHFNFSFYENQGIGRIKLEDFIISDSTIYPVFRHIDSSYTLSYIPNYRYPIWSSSQIVIRSDLDDYHTILYLQDD